MKALRGVISVFIALAFLFAFSPALLAQDMNKVNINKATVEEITQLKGVGPKYAERIVQYRTDNGPFKTPQDITKVPGIGQKIFEQNKENLITE
ncbi:MAG: helix-hairpin-helix domain-containing protein [Candidatus Aminicenantes bacterium]|nr:helix-hairpin-helix domain-containing protein [Candidatus Aminicenantes bacterium]